MTVRPEGGSLPSYHRTPEMEKLLIEAIARLIEAHPEQRFGQLIYNLYRSHHVESFYAYDEETIRFITETLT